jgi:hypothetical protein
MQMLPDLPTKADNIKAGDGLPVSYSTQHWSGAGGRCSSAPLLEIGESNLNAARSKGYSWRQRGRVSDEDLGRFSRDIAS